MNQNLIDFCKYVQPIITGCSGFIKTDGYMTHFPGVLITMSRDETQCCIIKIPIIFDVYMTSIINKFLSLKSPEQQSNMMNEIYFTGWNIVNSTLLNHYNKYDAVESTHSPIFYSKDCYELDAFGELVANTDIGSINIVINNPSMYCRVPVSKSITPVSKSDTVSMTIYRENNHYISPDILILRYSIFKKKFNLQVNMYLSIIG